MALTDLSMNLPLCHVDVRWDATICYYLFGHQTLSSGYAVPADYYTTTRLSMEARFGIWYHG
jgi:hypothetical protein